VLFQSIDSWAKKTLAMRRYRVCHLGPGVRILAGSWTPLDGTLNYVRQLPNYSVSVAVRRGNDIGLVLSTIRCWTSVFFSGNRTRRRMNGTPIHASSCEHLSRALIGRSFPPSGHATRPRSEVY